MAIDLLALRTAPPARPLPICTVVSDAAQAETLRPAWSDLLDRCERNELTQSPDWLLTWWRVYGSSQGRQMKLGLIHDGDRLVGLAPLLRRRHWYRGWLPFRRLELLASGEGPSDGICSNHVGILAQREYEATVAERIVEAIAGGAFGSWDEVVLPMMSGDTAMPELLVEAFRAAGYAAETTVMAGAPYITLPATWDAYLRGLSFNGRRNIERSLKAFDKWSQGTTELECVSAADLERGKQILTELHHDRWQSEGNAGVFRAPNFVRFHDLIMQRLAEIGALELLILRAHGEPVAAQYTMIWSGKVHVYQAGRKSGLPNNVRAGGVLDALTIRRAIEQGRREVDLLADEAFYKSQLTSTVRPLVQVRAARRCLVEGIRQIGRRLQRPNARRAKAEPREAP